MAIYPITHPSAPETQTSSSAAAIDIEAWTEQATQSLQAVSISSTSPAAARSAGLRGPTVSLTIPLDEHAVPNRPSPETHHPRIADQASYPTRREPLRRDSLKRREALLKGKEGSRRRQRWENGQFFFFGSSARGMMRATGHREADRLFPACANRSPAQQPLGATAAAERLGSAPDVSEARGAVLPRAAVGRGNGVPRVGQEKQARGEREG